MSDMAHEWVAKAEGDYHSLELEKPLLALLTKFAVHYGYPGESASKAEVKDAIKAMKQLRQFMRSKSALPK